MPNKLGRIAGEVAYREGDGVPMVIPQGACQITITDLDVTIGWADGANRGSTAIPLPDFDAFVKSGAIVLLD